MKPRLYIFAKAPIIGKVKTRLAVDTGHVHAVRIYKAMVSKILREMNDPRWETILYVTPDKYEHAGFGGLWPEHLPRLTQPQGTLTPRTAALFKAKGPVVCIGTDIPTMKRAYIAAAFKALKTNDAALGPARDGGFWLLGLNAPARAGLFGEVRWSHPQTGTDMIAAIDGKTALQPMLEDIDNLGAYRRYMSNI